MLDDLLTYINRELTNWNRISNEQTYSSNYRAYARGKYRAYENIKNWIEWNSGG